jgi:hypothetical protein
MKTGAEATMLGSFARRPYPPDIDEEPYSMEI